jgi:hypothetical protein
MKRRHFTAEEEKRRTAGRGLPSFTARADVGVKKERWLP